MWGEGGESVEGILWRRHTTCSSYSNELILIAKWKCKHNKLTVMALYNVPKATDLDELALRLFFDAWSRIAMIFEDFAGTFEIGDIPVDGDHIYQEEWIEYVKNAQNELMSIVSTIQNASELRLKAIICDVSPYLLLINSQINLPNSKTSLDFSELRTIDAVDLPSAVRIFTQFHLNEDYREKYNKIRKIRNKFVHLGSGHSDLSPREVAELLFDHYVELWPDGKWLFRRTKYDGNSTRRYFHDGRYSSVETLVMEEIPVVFELMGTKYIKPCFGYSKKKISGFCPNCISNIASKIGTEPAATVVRLSNSKALCLMCDSDVEISDSFKCSDCGESVVSNINSMSCCFNCGDELF
jgi:hypothetical protein